MAELTVEEQNTEMRKQLHALDDVLREHGIQGMPRMEAIQRLRLELRNRRVSYPDELCLRDGCQWGAE